jgi:hypothetical protein
MVDVRAGVSGDPAIVEDPDAVGAQQLGQPLAGADLAARALLPGRRALGLLDHPRHQDSGPT